MTDETPLRLPAPPDDYSDAECKAFYAGARRYVQALSGQHELILSALASGPIADADGPESETETETETETDTATGTDTAVTPDDDCPACGEDAVTAAFGTTRCTACGAVLD